MVRMTSNVGTGVRERLMGALEAVCEMTQDFTDSAYTPHHHREQILDFLEEGRFEMGNVLRPEVVSSPLCLLIRQISCRSTRKNFEVKESK